MLLKVFWPVSLAHDPATFVSSRTWNYPVIENKLNGAGNQDAPVHELFHDTMRKSESHELIRAVSVTISWITVCLFPCYISFLTV